LVAKIWRLTLQLQSELLDFGNWVRNFELDASAKLCNPLFTCKLTDRKSIYPIHDHQEQLVLLKRMEILLSMELTQYLSLRVENIT
jgi:hypothetical protein